MIDTDRFSWSESDIRRLVQQRAKHNGRKSAKSATVEIELPKPQRGEKFVRGPIPLDWIQAAIPCGRKSINVVLALWYLAGFKRSNPVKLTAAALALFDVSAQAARSILQRFELAELVNVDRKRGRSPIVTIRAVGDATGPDQ